MVFVISFSVAVGEMVALRGTHCARRTLCACCYVCVLCCVLSRTAEPMELMEPGDDYGAKAKVY